jgi:tryptophan synthase alpha chain
MNLNVLFDELAELRKRVTIPILLMGYSNPMIQYGVERFCKKAAEVGVDGVIVPDLPMYEYEKLYSNYFKDNNLSNIFLVTPQTAEERIRKIDELSNSFIYLLSSASITGKALDLNDTVDTYFKRIEDMRLKNPTIVGFGIAGKAAFDKACQYNRGAIVGSAFVKYLNSAKDYLAGIPEFIGQIKG